MLSKIRFVTDLKGRTPVIMGTKNATEDLTEAGRLLEVAHPREILAWGVERFFPRLTMATAFGPEGCVILHMLAEIEPRVRVFNLDTGYQFEETLRLRDRIAERYGIEVELARPNTTVEEFERANGGPVYSHDPDRCCFERKIVPLRQAIVGYDAWISAIRADQSSSRARADVIGWDGKFDLVKINPLLRWTSATSGRSSRPTMCRTTRCTTRVIRRSAAGLARGPSLRVKTNAGRWVGQAKTECGLHSLDSSQL